ncbi:SHOCT domain-containing protein [Thermodesulfobacteriota bacterium]
MMLMNVFWILILIGLLFYLVKWLTRSSKTGQLREWLPDTNSMEILKERYARGEIERDEFEQKKQDLENMGV